MALCGTMSVQTPVTRGGCDCMCCWTRWGVMVQEIYDVAAPDMSPTKLPQNVRGGAGAHRLGGHSVPSFSGARCCAAQTSRARSRASSAVRRRTRTAGASTLTRPTSLATSNLKAYSLQLASDQTLGFYVPSTVEVLRWFFFPVWLRC